jgi:hypothetical protein
MTLIERNAMLAYRHGGAASGVTSRLSPVGH